MLFRSGLTGCEMAYEMVLNGKEVHVVEMLNDLVCTKGVCLANTSFLREALAFHHADIRLNTQAKKIEKNGVYVLGKDGNEVRIPCDTVIYSIGYRPNPIAQASKHVHVIGDANKVGNLRTVIWGAWDIAMKL